MKKMNKWIITFGIVISVLSFSFPIMADSDSINIQNNSRTQPESDTSSQTLQGNEILDGFEKVASADNLELYLQKETLSIQVKEKVSGYVYSSFADSAEGMNEIWQNFDVFRYYN